MRFGVTLPTFRSDAAALEAARTAKEAGVDGVFVFDHLWPMGRPDRPALSAFVVLGAVAGITEQVVLGTLVARVGLVPDEVLLAQFASLEALAPSRVVAGLGTGDAKSAAENEAYGYERLRPGERIASLEWCARELVERGSTVWIGGGSGSPRMAQVARRTGAALNLWQVGPEAVALYRPGGEVTWGGDLPGDEDEALSLLERLHLEGATWAVASWKDDAAMLERLARFSHSLSDGAGEGEARTK